MKESTALRLRALAARLLPGEFREQWGAEMETAFREQLADARARGPGAVWRLTRRELADLIGTAVGQWVGGMRTTPTGGGVGMSGSWLETRQAVRTLVRRPGFAAVAVTSLSLGIGLATAMFALVDGVLLQPLAYREPDRLANVFLTIPSLGWEQGPVSYPNFEDWRARSGAVFESLSAHQSGARRVLTPPGGTETEPRIIRGSLVSGEMFETLGRPAVLGRTIESADEGADRERVVVLSHALWSTAFAGDRAIVGRTIELSNQAHRVVGVMPADFPGVGRNDEFWIPFNTAIVTADRDSHFLTMIGRLRAGVDEAAAAAAMQDLAVQIESESPGWLENRRILVVSHADVVTGGVRAQLLVLLGAVGLLLVIACANLAGLLLARGIARRRELALREALGASRSRLIRGLLTESVLLALAGAVLAIPVAQLVLQAVLALGPADLPRREEVAIGPLSLLVCAALAVASAVASGLLPALRSVRLRTAWSTKLATEGRTTGDPHPRLQQGLAVAQVAVTTVLLIGGGLLGLSFFRLQRADPGFVADGLLTFHITPPPGAYQERDELVAFHGSILEGLEALPGVKVAGATWALPLGDAYGSSGYVPEDRPGSESLVVEIAPVVGDYFEAMGMRIVAGRAVVLEDDGETETGVLVSESLARRAWPGLDPVGRVLVEDDDPDERLRVVGVVAEVAMRGADANPELETFWPWNGNPWGRSLYYVARTDGDPLALLPAVRDLVRRIDPRVPVAEPSTMSERMSRHFAGPRFRTLLVGVFGVGAALLSLMGIYGVTSFTVRRRTRELGVRKALGAQRGGLVLAVLGRGLAMAGAGALIGIAGAALGARAIEGLLFQVAPLEGAVYGAVALLVVVAAAVACAVPALRAASVPPTVALSAD